VDNCVTVEGGNWYRSKFVFVVLFQLNIIMTSMGRATWRD